ncbi:MAG TPA: hypothetical protein VGD40_04395 [Chryseosolibacter sp.]
MSTKKRLGVIAGTALLLLAIGLIKVTLISTTAASENQNFVLEYMTGYSIPILGMGIIVFVISSFLLKEKKSMQATHA